MRKAVALPDPDRTHWLRVGPLSLGALHQMLRERAGRSFPRPVLSRIEQISGGNPFYALELARSSRPERASDLASLRPGTLAQLVQARVDGLPTDVQRALLAASAMAEPSVMAVELALGTGPAAALALLSDWPAARAWAGTRASVSGVTGSARNWVRRSPPG